MPKNLIHSITVFNNDPHIDLSDLSNPMRGGDRRVTVVGASRNVGIGYNRFFAATLGTTKAVLTQDDDLILDESAVRELYKRWKEEPDRIHGAFCRGPYFANAEDSVRSTETEFRYSTRDYAMQSDILAH